MHKVKNLDSEVEKGHGCGLAKTFSSLTFFVIFKSLCFGKRHFK